MAYTFDTTNPSGLQPQSADDNKPVKYSFEPAKSEIVGSSYIDTLIANTTYDTEPLSSRTGTQVSSAAFRPELDETKAVNQGYGELAVKALTNFTLSGIGGAIGGTGTLANVDKIRTFFDGSNNLSKHAYAEDNFLESLGKSIEEAGPTVYQTQAAKDGFALGDKTWWAGTAVPGLASMVGIMLPAYGVGKGFSLLGKSLEKASLLTKLKSTGKFAELTSTMTKGTGSFLAGEWGQTISTALAGRMIDSGQSAGQTYKELYAGFKADGFDEDKAKNMAAEGARHAYRVSYANIVFDLFEWNTMLKGLGKTSLTKTAYEALDSSLESKLGKGLGANMLESQITKTIDNPIKDALLTSFVEGLDEVTMDASQNLGKRRAESEAYGTPLTPYLTRQSADSAFIGAFGGLVSFGLFRYLGKKGNVERDKQYQTYVDNIVQRATSLRDEVNLISQASAKGHDVVVDMIQQSGVVKMATRAFSSGMHKIDMEVLKNLSSKKSKELTQEEIDDATANGMSVNTPEAAAKMLDIYKQTVSNLEIALSNKTTRRAVNTDLSNYYNEIDNSKDSDSIKQEKKAFIKEHFDELSDHVITHRTINKTQHDLLQSKVYDIQNSDIETRAEYDNWDKIFNDPDIAPTVSMSYAKAKASVMIHDNSFKELQSQKEIIDNQLITLANHKNDIANNVDLTETQKQTELDKSMQSEIELKQQLSDIEANLKTLESNTDIQERRILVDELDKQISDLGLTPDSKLEDYDKLKTQLDELQQNGKLSEEDRQFLDDYYKHQHNISKYLKLSEKLNISENQVAFLEQSINSTKTQSEATVSEIVDKIYKSNVEKDNILFDSIKESIDANRLNEKALIGLKTKIQSNTESRYVELIKVIDSHLKDIAEATRIRNERKAEDAKKQPIRETSGTTSQSSTTSSSKSTTSDIKTVYQMVIDLLPTETAKAQFKAFSNSQGSAPKVVHITSEYEIPTDATIESIPDKFLNISDEVLYASLADAIKLLNQHTQVVKSNNKTTYAPLNISNAQFNVLLDSLQSAYNSVINGIAKEPMLIDVNSIYNATFLIAVFQKSAIRINEISPLGENSNKSPQESNKSSIQEPTDSKSEVILPNDESELPPQIEQQPATLPADASDLVDRLLSLGDEAKDINPLTSLRHSELSDESQLLVERKSDTINSIVDTIDALYKLNYGNAPYKVSYYGLLHTIVRAKDFDFAIKNADRILATLGFLKNIYIPDYNNTESENHAIAVDIVNRFQLLNNKQVPNIDESTKVGFHTKTENILRTISNTFEAKYAGSNDLFAYTRAANKIEVNSDKTIVRDKDSVTWLNTMLGIQAGDSVSFEVVDTPMMQSKRTKTLGEYANSDLFKPIVIKKDSVFIGEVPDIQITDGGIYYVKVGTKDGAITHRFNSYIDSLLNSSNQPALKLLVEHQTLLKEIFLSKSSDRLEKLQEVEELYNLFKSFAIHNLKFNSTETEDSYELSNEQLHELLKPIFVNSNQQWFDDIVLDETLLRTNYAKYNAGKKEQYETTVAIRTTLKDKKVGLTGIVSNKSMPSLIFGNTNNLIQDVLQPYSKTGNNPKLQLAVIKPGSSDSTLYDASTGVPIDRTLISNIEDLEVGTQKGNMFMLIPRGDGKFTILRTSNSILGITKGSVQLNNMNTMILSKVGDILTDLLLSDDTTERDYINKLYTDLHQYVITNFGKRDADIWLKPIVGFEGKPNMILFKTFDSSGKFVYKQIRITRQGNTFKVVEGQSESLNESFTGLDKSLEGKVVSGTTVVNKTFDSVEALRGYLTQQSVGLMRNVPIEGDKGLLKINMPRATSDSYKSDVLQHTSDLFPNNPMLDFLLTTGAIHTKLGKISDDAGNVLTNFNYGNNDSTLKGLSKGGLYFKATTNSLEKQVSQSEFNVNNTEDLRNWQPFEAYLDLLPKQSIAIVRQTIPENITEGKRTRATIETRDGKTRIILYDAFFKTTTGLNRNVAAMASDLAHELLHNIIDNSQLRTLLDKQQELSKSGSNDIVPELKPLVEFRQSLIDILDSIPSEVDRNAIKELIDYTEISSGRLDELITNGLFNANIVRILSSLSTNNVIDSNETFLDKLVKVLVALLNVGDEIYDKSKLKELSNIVTQLLKESISETTTVEITESTIESKVKSKVNIENNATLQTSSVKNRVKPIRNNSQKRSELSENYTIFDSDMKAIC